MNKNKTKKYHPTACKGLNKTNCIFPCAFVEEKLKDWPNCNRMAWDMWDFKSRREAEKFITLFHLSWDQ